MRNVLIALAATWGLAGQSVSGGDVVVYEPQSYYVVPPLYAYSPVFATPPTVLVQRPVYVAQPVVVAEPVFLESPVLAAPPVVAPVTSMPYVTYPVYGTSVRYRTPLFPFGHRSKLEYQVHTAYGTHKYKYRQSWRDGSTRFEYDFDD